MESFKPSYLVFIGDLGFLLSRTKRYKKDALDIKNGKFSSCSPSFHLLSSLVFELFPKVLIGYKICEKYRDDTLATEESIREEIGKEMRKYNHDLCRLYHNFPDLMKYLDMNKILQFEGDYVWEYRVTLNTDEEISLKDIEAIRYGSFAKTKDIATLCVYDEIIINLLEKLEEYIEKESEKTRKILEGKII